MSVNRRTFLKGAGVVTLVFVGGGVWRAVDTGALTPASGKAYEPWDDWSNARPQGVMALVHAATLAASAHNTQPWQFRVTENSIELFADTSRHIGSFDPYLREMHQSLGCALENMLVAAEHEGYSVELTVPEGRLDVVTRIGAPHLVARLDLLESSARTTPLFGSIGTRRTDRGRYDSSKDVGGDVLGEMPKLAHDIDGVSVHFFNDGPKRERLDAMMVAATEEIVEDADMMMDSDAWFRLSRKRVEEHRDGVTLDALGLPPFILAMAKMMPPLPSSRVHQGWIDSTRDIQLASAPVMGVITTADPYDRALALSAGRVWQRMQLWSTVEHLSMQPMSQILERIDRDRQLSRPEKTQLQLQQTLSLPEPSTFMFRMGHPTRTPHPSPRRAPESVIL